MENILPNQWGIKHPWDTIQIPYNELARTLFPVESTTNIKIKRAHHKIVGDGCIWEETSLMNDWWVSQLVLCQVLNAVIDAVCI